MGESAFAWVGQIVEWFGQWVPRRTILAPNEGALKYVRGNRVVECGPGIHVWWPATTRFLIFPTARQTDRLESQAMESSDGITFIVSALITYRVSDLTALLTTTHDPDVAIRDMAMAAVHDVCADKSWATLQADHRHVSRLKTELRNAAQAQLREYGVNVIKVQLNSLARCRVVRLSQSTSSEEN